MAFDITFHGPVLITIIWVIVRFKINIIALQKSFAQHDALMTQTYASYPSY